MRKLERNFPAYYGIIGIVALGGLQLLWSHVANRATMPEPTRAQAKDLTFWSGVLTFLIFAGFIAVRVREKWWRAAALALLIALVGSSVVVVLASLLSDQGWSRNSALLGESGLTQVAAGAWGIVLYALTLTGIGLLWGALLCKIWPKHRGG